MALLALTISLAACNANPVLRMHGLDALGTDDLKQAEAQFAQAVEQDPTDWKSLYHLGVIRLQQGNALDAQLLLERALVLRRDHAETADILDALAQALSQAKRIDDLHALINQAVDDYGSSRDYIRQGSYLHQLGDIDGAKFAYRKAAYFAKPGDAQPFVNLADFYEQIGDTANAVTSLRHAYGINPKDRLIAERLRNYGIVPGPTAAIKLQNEK